MTRYSPKKAGGTLKRFFQEGRRRIRTARQYARTRAACTHDDRHQHPLRTGPATRGLSAGGIEALFLLAQKIELVQEIDRKLHLLKRHLPYHESDHVLNIAFNILAGGLCIEHLELQRNDEVYLDALGARRIPDPTTAGDFCRRFTEDDVLTLMAAIDEARLRVPTSSRPSSSPRRSSRPMVASCPVMPSANGGWISPMTAVWLPSAGDLAGQYGRTALPAQSQWQPPLPGTG